MGVGLNVLSRLLPAVVVGVLLAAESALAADRNQVGRVLTETDVRRNAGLRGLLAKPYPPNGAWRHENFAMAAYYLDQSTAEADEGILTVLGQEFPDIMKGEKNQFHWHAYIQERILFLFGSRSRFFAGRMSPAAEDAILEMLWQWASPRCRLEMTLPERDWWIWGSENHHIMAWASFWGAAQIFSRHPDYSVKHYDDGSTPAQMLRGFNEYFKRFARQRAAKGLLVECGSPTYGKYSVNTWYNFADFAEDPELKRRFRMLLDLYWADWAVEQIDGVRGGSRHRCYPERSSVSGSDGAGRAWFHFGLGPTGSLHPGYICAATTFYRPAPVVVALALDPDGRGEYEYVSRRPGLLPGVSSEGKKPEVSEGMNEPGFDYYVLDPNGGGMARYTWCTPDFVLGTSMVPALRREDWSAISSQNRWEGVIFAGHPTARIFVQSPAPEKGSLYNANWSVQDRGVLIVQRLKGSNARGQRVWFDKSLPRTEKDGWVFAEAPRAFAAVRVLSGGTSWEADGPRGTPWLACKDEFSPIIIEVAGKSDFPSSDAFQAAILANPMKFANNRVDYQSTIYDTRLALFADYSQPPQVNGEPVDYRAQKVYDCPFIQSDFGDGVVVIKKGQEELSLDFNTAQ